MTRAPRTVAAIRTVGTVLASEAPNSTRIIQRTPTTPITTVAPRMTARSRACRVIDVSIRSAPGTPDRLVPGYVNVYTLLLGTALDGTLSSDDPLAAIRAVDGVVTAGSASRRRHRRRRRPTTRHRTTPSPRGRARDRRAGRATATGHRRRSSATGSSGSVRSPSEDSRHTAGDGTTDTAGTCGDCNSRPGPDTSHPCSDRADDGPLRPGLGAALDRRLAPGLPPPTAREPTITDDGMHSAVMVDHLHQRSSAEPVGRRTLMTVRVERRRRQRPRLGAHHAHRLGP